MIPERPLVSVQPRSRAPGATTSWVGVSWSATHIAIVFSRYRELVFTLPPWLRRETFWLLAICSPRRRAMWLGSAVSYLHVCRSLRCVPTPWGLIKAADDYVLAELRRERDKAEGTAPQRYTVWI